MRSLPFYTNDLNGGLMMLDGILRIEKGILHFEFQKKDAVLDVYKSELMSIEIPLSEISMMEYKKGFFISKLIIYSKKASAFKDLPGSSLTERVLRVKKKHREIAASISSNVNLELSERKLRELDKESE